MSGKLADIAKKVGVSQATVSRVLNEKPGISKKTTEAVLTALDVLGYERPAHLRSNQPKLVGLVIPELANPIFPVFADSICSALVSFHLTPILCICPVGGTSEEEYVDLMLEQHVSGVIFIGGRYSEADSNHNHYRLLEERGVPSIYINAGNPEVKAPSVVCDDAVAVQLALSHLGNLGHKKIGLLLGRRDHIPSRKKYAKAVEIARQHGIALEVEWSDYSLESGQALGAVLIKQGVTAIVCASDMLALGAVRAANRLNLRVPADISIIGYDDSPMMSFTEPALTTVHQPVDRMGLAAVQNLIPLMESTKHKAIDKLVFEPQLIVRNSTARVCQQQ